MVTLDELTGVVSPSRLETAQRCLAQFCFRYVERIRERWRSSLSFGRAVDDCGTSTYTRKIQNGTTPVAREVQELFAQAWEWESEAVDDWEDGDSKGALLDTGVRAVARWRDAVAQYLDPLAVQNRLQMGVQDSQGDAFGVQGILDVRGTVRGVPVVADLKTAGKTYRPDAFARRMQPAAYTLLTGVSRFEFHVLTKAKEPQVQVLRWLVPDTERTSFVRRAGMIRRMIGHAFRSGDWLPNRSHYLCTRRHCEFWATCERRYGGRVPK